MNTSSSANSSDANQSDPDIIPNHPLAPIPNHPLAPIPNHPLAPNLNHPLAPIPDHPLAAIAGKFEGEIWEATLEEIQRLRRLDRKRWEKAVEINRDAG